MPDKKKLTQNILNNRYEIKQILGEGGLGVVYEAFDPVLQISVAVKLLHADSEGQALVRLQREAVTAGKMQNTNIAKVFDFGQTDDGLPYMVMELVSGRSLAELLSESGALDYKSAIAIFIQICQGLEHAHTNGVVHRDLKPSNVMLVDSDGSNLVKLLDFGIAKIETDQKLTSTGAVLGSPLYMSPEQAAGLEVTFKSDLYSLGCLMFETLSGKPPIEGKSALETISMHRNTAPPLLSDVMEENLPSALINLVDLCLRKLPEARPKDAAEIKDILQNILTPKAVAVATPASEPKKINIEDAKKLTETSKKTQKAVVAVTTFISVFTLILLIFSVKHFQSTNVSKNSTRLNQEILKEKDTAKFDAGFEHLSIDNPKFDFPTYKGKQGVEGEESVNDEDLKDLKNTTACYLKLKNSNVTGTGLKYLVGTTITNVELRTKDFNPANLVLLIPHKTLTKLKLDKDVIDDNSIKYVLNLKTIEELSIYSKKLTDKGLAGLADMPNLRRLKLKCKQLTDKSVDYISRIATLKELDFEGCPELSESVGEKVAKIKTLNYFKMPCNQTLKSLIALSKSNIEQLEIDGLQFDAAQFDALCSMSKLTYLRLSNVMLNGNGMNYQKLLNLRNLKELDLGHEKYFAPGLLAVLEKLPVSDIDLHDSEIKKDQLFRLLNNPNLNRIILVKCDNITDEMREKFHNEYLAKWKKDVDLEYGQNAGSTLEHMKMNPNAFDTPR